LYKYYINENKFRVTGLTVHVDNTTRKNLWRIYNSYYFFTKILRRLSKN
jgi:hypothetical protein